MSRNYRRLTESFTKILIFICKRSSRRCTSLNPIFLALDFPTWKETQSFIEKNNLDGVPVKVGMELFYREGRYVIEQLKLRNHPIFLDLKLHDIPTTVMRAMRNLATLEVD